MADTDGTIRVGEADAALDRRLSDELDRVNAAATRGTAPARELTVQVHDDAGELAAGMSGWTWGVAAGIGMTWVREDTRGAGLGARLLAEFEAEARERGCSARTSSSRRSRSRRPASTNGTATARSSAGRTSR